MDFVSTVTDALYSITSRVHARWLTTPRTRAADNQNVISALAAPRPTYRCQPMGKVLQAMVCHRHHRFVRARALTPELAALERARIRGQARARTQGRARALTLELAALERARIRGQARARALTLELAALERARIRGQAQARTPALV